jgi:hypothetical protein
VLPWLSTRIPARATSETSRIDDDRLLERNPRYYGEAGRGPRTHEVRCRLRSFPAGRGRGTTDRRQRQDAQAGLPHHGGTIRQASQGPDGPGRLHRTTAHRDADPRRRHRRGGYQARHPDNPFTVFPERSRPRRRLAFLALLQARFRQLQPRQREAPGRPDRRLVLRGNTSGP